MVGVNVADGVAVMVGVLVSVGVLLGADRQIFEADVSSPVPHSATTDTVQRYSWSGCGVNVTFVSLVVRASIVSSEVKSLTSTRYMMPSTVIVGEIVASVGTAVAGIVVGFLVGVGVLVGLFVVASTTASHSQVAPSTGQDLCS